MFPPQGSGALLGGKNTWTQLQTFAGVASGATIVTAQENTPYTVVSTDEVVLINAAFNITLNLPAANANAGRRLVIVKTDASATTAVTVTRAGSDTIEGVASKSLSTQYAKIELVSDGVSTWYIEESLAVGAVSSVNTVSGAVTLATPNSTLTIASSGQNVNIDLKLGNANTWTAVQTFNAGIVFGAGSIAATSAFVEADAVGGNLLANAPTGKNIGLQIAGTNIVLVGSSSVTAGSDGAISLGTATTRWTTVNVGTGFNVYAASADANASAQLGNNFFKLGPGGGTALAVQLQSSTTLALRATTSSSVVQNLTGTRTELDIVPVSGQVETNLFLTNALNTTTVTGFQVQVNAANIFINSMGGSTATTGLPMVFQMLVASAQSEVFRITAAPILQLSSGFSYTITSVSANYTVLVTDLVILDSASGAANTVTLPAASNQKGRVVVVIKTDSSANAVTVSRAGADTIQGATTITLGAQYSKATLISDGTATWYDLSATLV